MDGRQWFSVSSHQAVKTPLITQCYHLVPETQVHCCSGQQCQNTVLQVVRLTKANGAAVASSVPPQHASVVRCNFMNYFLVDIVPGETQIALSSVGNSLFPARLHSSESLHLHFCFQRLKELRFVATALGLGAAWKRKKKSIIFLLPFSPVCHVVTGMGQQRR